MGDRHGFGAVSHIALGSLVYVMHIICPDAYSLPFLCSFPRDVRPESSVHSARWTTPSDHQVIRSDPEEPRGLPNLANRANLNGGGRGSWHGRQTQSSRRLHILCPCCLIAIPDSTLVCSSVRYRRRSSIAPFLFRHLRVDRLFGDPRGISAVEFLTPHSVHQHRLSSLTVLTTIFELANAVSRHDQNVFRTQCHVARTRRHSPCFLPFRSGPGCRRRRDSEALGGRRPF